ncbi:MAG: NupC/NupG family nucleoside CNT transporter, partial [Lysobacterales bacterium CG_4_9_14_3_um_filter_62_6]
MCLITSVLFGLFGLACLLGIAFIFSNNKKSVDWVLVATGVGLQIAFAIFVLLTPWGSKIFEALAHGFVTLAGFTLEGSKMIF